MAPLRPTSTTALPIVRQLGADLARWVREIGLLAAAPGLSESVDALLAATRDEAIEAQVLIEETTDPVRLADVAPRIMPGLSGPDLLTAFTTRERICHADPGTGTAWRLRVDAVGAPRGQAAGTMRPSVVIAVGTSSDPFFVEAIGAACDDCPIFFWLGDPSAVPATAAWVTEVVPPQAADTVWDRINQPPLRDMEGVLRAESALRALQSLAGVCGTALEQELRSVRARRVIAQQNAARVQQRPPASGNELLTEVRAKVQRQFTEFIRGVEDRATIVLAPLTGPVWQSVDEDLREITDLEREPRVKTTALRVAESRVRDWLSGLEERLVEHCSADLVAMRDLFRLVEGEIEQIVAAAAGPPVLPRLQFFDDERIRRMMSTHLVVQRTYSGEVPRPGLFEYAMVARRYQMIAFMFISAFGLSFLRTYREFMLPSAVLLLSLGGLNVYVSVRRERVETLEKELERARESLRAETRRILTEVQRAWVAAVTQHLSDQVGGVMTQLETSIRAHQGREAASLAQERQRLQRQLQALETAERRLSGAVKGRDAAAASFAQLRGELRPLFGNPARPSVARV